MRNGTYNLLHVVLQNIVQEDPCQGPVVPKN